MPGGPGPLIYLCLDADGVTVGRGKELHSLPSALGGVRIWVSRSSPSLAVAPCYQRMGEQMVGSGLALPRRLAAKRWRQAGAKETWSVSARGGGNVH